ncbi:hypothetical protein [Bdellovibrio sp. NC01]|uniref:hypothetical protein n=1 Tax=Bdellovibrio sp. NC01 TaxID=2220073 RepID=UPI001158725A|nr:hypothetical protein [Bdellovibrio sp. NC01]QDK39375.1 hypothetical protein DOE51_18130 [Bdellovibrio sp. NC01]
MLPMLNKHTLITAALMASMSLTACGSKKDVFTPPAKQGTETNNKGETQTGGEIGGGLSNPDQNSNGKNNTEPPLPLPDYSDLPNPGSGQKPPAPPAPGVPSAPSTPAPLPPPVTDTKPSPSLGTNPLPPDYRSNDASQVGRDNLTKRMTGGVTADGLVYTSSATDELLNFLRARNERVDQFTRQANLDAAASVLSAKLTVDGLSGDAIVTLKIQEGRDVKVYNVAGSMSEGGYSSALKSVRAGNGERTTGQRSLEGTIKCLDLDGLCENTFVRLKLGSQGSSSIVNVVFRNSAADLYFSLPGKYSDNPEYLQMREFIRNTILQANSENKIKQARMSSFEVINGRSGVALTLKGYNNELLGFSGPLLAPEAGTGVNITLSRIAKDQDDSLDLISLDRSQLNYANWIGDARMVANNGLGQVKLALKMRKRSAYAQDAFTVTFMRKIKPLVDLTDDNLK